MTKMSQSRVFPVKICGLTRWEDVSLAAELGAWALGFIFYPKSRRYIAPEEVRLLIDQLHEQFQRPIKTVAVVVNETRASLQDLVAKSGVDTVQLHGDESAEILQNISEHLEVDIIKAFRPKEVADLEGMEKYQAANHFLIDAAVDGAYGGTGHKADWSLAKHVQSKAIAPLILSGGITAENVVAAVREVQPVAVDLSSGVEKSPGIKSHTKLRELFRQLKEQRSCYETLS
ncbi:MAG: phosphoribosylanthranilate isomerase [Oligoflexus sp.]